MFCTSMICIVKWNGKDGEEAECKLIGFSYEDDKRLKEIEY